MDGNPTFGHSPQQARYLRFLQATLRGDDPAIEHEVNTDAFAAFLPGQGRLVLDQFQKLLASLREISPDFGNTVTVLNWLERDGLLCVMYQSVYTITGRRIEHTSTDWVSFDDQGKVTELRVFYDLADTREQVFGKRITFD